MQQPPNYIDKLAYVHLVNHKILVTLSRGKTVWYIPGGKREPQESDRAALIREVKEELAVDLIPESIKPYATFEAQAHGKPDGTIVRMTCYTGEYIGALKASSEIEAIDFFAFDQKALTSTVDHLIFNDLRQKGLLA